MNHTTTYNLVLKSVLKFITSCFKHKAIWWIIWVKVIAHLFKACEIFSFVSVLFLLSSFWSKFKFFRIFSIPFKHIKERLHPHWSANYKLLLLPCCLNVTAETNSLRDFWHAGSIRIVCQPFSGLSFGACASILCLMLRARRPYTANSLTYPSRQRATGLFGLMGLTDHNRATLEKAEKEVGREPLSVVFFFFFLVPIWRNLVWLKFTKHSCKQWVCLWFTTVSDHAELLRFGFLLTLGLSHHGDLWPDKNRISATDLYSCNSKEYVMLLTFKLCLKVYFHTPKHFFSTTVFSNIQ